MEISKTIQQLRKGAGLSQEALAEQLGLSRQAVSKWESGAAIPSLENLIELSRIFGVPAGTLLQPEDAGEAAAPCGSGETLPLEGVRELLAQMEAACLCAMVLAAGFLYLNGQVAGLRQQLQSLDGRVNGMGSEVADRVESVAAGLREQFREQENLTADYDWRVVDYDYESGQATLEISALPKTDQPELSASFTLSGGAGEPVTAPASREAGGRFSARVTLKPADEMKLSVSFETPDGQTNHQLLEILYGLESRYQMTATVAFEGKIQRQPGQLLLEGRAAVQVTAASGDQESSWVNWPVRGELQVWSGNQVIYRETIEAEDSFFSPDSPAEIFGPVTFYIPLEGISVEEKSSELRTVWVDNFGREHTARFPLS